MNHKYLAIILFALSIGLIAIGQLISHPEIIGLCEGNGSWCISQNMLFGIGHPLLVGIYWLPPFFFALIFIRKEMFWKWLVLAVPLAGYGLYLILITHPFGGHALGFDRVDMTIIVSKLFVILGAIFIAGDYAWFFYSKKSKA